MTSPIAQNTIDLRSILDTVNSLPEASNGVELPELSNEGAASDLLSGKQLIDSNGEVVTGTFTLDTELNAQDDLIAQLQSAVDSLPDSSPGVELPELTNEGTASDLLSGKQLIDGDGNLIVGTIPTKTSGSVTTDGPTVDIPAGYYASAVSKTVATTSRATPSISVDSAGKITATTNQATGYVYSGTQTATKQLTTQAAKTITPSTSSQTAVDSGVYTTGAVTVGAIPSTYVKPTATKAATTYTPSTSNQTIAAGTYCSGVQTIKGDTNLKAENIAEGVSIFGVTGTHSGGSGSGGSDSNIEIKTFTCTQDMTFITSGHSVYTQNPFLDGMTWEEFISSPLNFYRYNEIMTNNKYYIYLGYISIYGPGGFICQLTVDGTASGRVLPTDKIIAMEYDSWVDAGNFD